VSAAQNLAVICRNFTLNIFGFSTTEIVRYSGNKKMKFEKAQRGKS